MSRIRLAALLTTMGLIAVAVAGCGGDNAPSAPLSQFQPEIVNVADNFSLQATAVQNVTTTLTYTWANSGSRATINHSSTVDSGTAAVSIFDANNSLVYTNGLVTSSNQSSSVGVAGDWRIVVSFSECYGTLNFSVQML